VQKMASIRKRGDKWQARIQRSGYPDLAKSFNNRVDADRWGRITESEINRGVYESRIEIENTTLNDVLIRYKTEITPTKKKGSNKKVIDTKIKEVKACRNWRANSHNRVHSQQIPRAHQTGSHGL
jgi:hypothetical protein